MLHEILEADTIDLECGLEAYAEIAITHSVLVGVGDEEAEVAGDGEKEIVVPWRKVGELILEPLGHPLSYFAFFRNPGLDLLG